jgi:hypothetical protein
MSEINTRWTSDHLRRPGGTAVYAAQMRERLRQMADEVQALQREYRADLESERLDGDRPFEAKFRAYQAARPLSNLESDLRSAVTNAGKLDKEYQRRYVELPVKREKKKREKALEQDRKKGLANSRAMNTAGQVQGLALGLSEPEDGKDLSKVPAGSVYVPPQAGQEQSFMDFLQKRA